MQMFKGPRCQDEALNSGLSVYVWVATMQPGAGNLSDRPSVAIQRGWGVCRPT